MDLGALRERLTTAYRTRSEQALELVDRIPILGRLLSEFVRIEFIDRCMLIAAQGLLALIPTFVVLVAFFPDLISVGLGQFTSATGLGPSGSASIAGEVTVEQVRAQTGVIGVLIVLFSATSFGRAIQRMYERVWEQPHIGGVSGARRCFVWLVGWLLSIQVVAGVLGLMSGLDGLVPSVSRLLIQMGLLTMLWLVTSWLLLFGRVRWWRLVVGAALTGVLQVIYTRGSGFVMPAYVENNSEQFGTLGVILSISTWMIGFGAILVGSALVGRVVSEDPTVVRLVRSTVAAVPGRLSRRQAPEDERAAR
ncbi:MAG: YhjD/YihY/BrkB family envelope integrity protein [Nocardioides sp.]